MPVLSAAPLPRFTSCWKSFSPGMRSTRRAATLRLESREQSSTMISSSSKSSSAISNTLPTQASSVFSSLKQGMTRLSFTRGARFASMWDSLELCPRYGELVVQLTAREQLEVLDRAELAFQRGDAAVLGGEKHHLGAFLFLFANPALELRAAGDERGHAVTGVEILALPIHLIGDERLFWAFARSVVGQDRLTLAPMGCGAHQVYVEPPSGPGHGDQRKQRE